MSLSLSMMPMYACCLTVVLIVHFCQKSEFTFREITVIDLFSTNLSTVGQCFKSLHI